jgi:hypothetical protein
MSDSTLSNVGAEYINMIVECFMEFRAEQLHGVLEKSSRKSRDSY